MRFQGILVTESYAQLASMLESSLSPEHAFFLAEPVHEASGESTDWYSKAEGTPVPLSSLPPEEQAEARAAIARIASDINGLAEELKDGGGGSKSIRGNILSLALRYPGPDHIYMAGKQPVLTCWGFDPGTLGAQPEDLMRLGAVASAAAAATATAAPAAVAAAPVAAAASFAWWKALLYLLLGVLLLTGLFLLAGLLLGPAAGCTVPEALQPIYGGCAPAAPPVPPAVNATTPEIPEENPLVSALTAEQEKERSLRLQLEDLRRRLSERAAQCVPPKQETPPEPPKEEDPITLADLMPSTPDPVEEPKPEPKPKPKPKPEPKAKPGEDLKIPEDARKNNDMSFLEGCWSSDSGLVSMNTGDPILVEYCFDAKGRGSRKITNTRNKDRCTGNVRAKFDASGRLIIDADSASCLSGGKYVPQHVECTDGKGNKTTCYGKEKGGRSNKWDAKFRRS